MTPSVMIRRSLIRIPEIPAEEIRHSNGRPKPPREHGTTVGHRQHRSEGEKPCEPCREANSAYERTRQAKLRARKAAASTSTGE